MSEFGKSIVTWAASPWSWLALAGTAIATVWGFKLNASLSNCMLVLAIGLFGAAVCLLPWIATQPVVIRGLFVLAAISSAGIAAYYTLWTKQGKLGIFAIVNYADKVPGTQIAGITWSPKFSHISLTLQNASTRNYTELDLKIVGSQAIAKMGQVSGLEQATFGWYRHLAFSASWVEPGKESAIDLIPIATDDGWRVRLPALPSKSSMEIALAMVEVSKKAVRPTPEVDEVLSINFVGGTSQSFARRGHSDAVFLNRPQVTEIKVSGTFKVDGLETEVDKTVVPEDLIQMARKNLGGIMPPPPPKTEGKH